jgi:hypothetical protein
MVCWLEREIIGTSLVVKGQFLLFYNKRFWSCRTQFSFLRSPVDSVLIH